MLHEQKLWRMFIFPAESGEPHSSHLKRCVDDGCVYEMRPTAPGRSRPTLTSNATRS